MNRASTAYYDITEWTDEEVSHVLEGAGAITQVIIGIYGHDKELLDDVDDPRWDAWKNLEYANLRRAVLDAYLYGIYINNLGCEKWHKHCRDAA